ncbi:hypothetical protein NEOLEDRAFT_1245330 [Neolentinus lepideus HHB14362 ss-1]|uniref:Transcription activator of gluconeogenesis ERT1 n=1 Tax=Neolentinus lepideus HHB14362 ss-1 TaxID=1314782 RepID=A0A165NXS6_9AGAM|nr:hypothetical protein NEOLEDRAFT_1245330 [Neolentinus lepideus HHB14362 ss-1]
MSSPAIDAADEQHDSPPAQDLQPSMTMHPVAYPGMPVHMYPFPTSMVSSQPLRTKRRQVKNACTNCQKACKKCDDARPCLRCVKYGIAEECIDSQRKERKKGIKRGPYKKRDGKGSSTSDRADSPSASAPTLPPTLPPTGMPSAQMSYMPFGYYGQYPPGVPSKPGEAPAYFPPFYFAPVAAAPQQLPGQDGEGTQGYPVAPQFFPILTPYGQPYPPYMMPHRLDGQVPATSFAAYPPIFPKPPSTGGHTDGSSSSGKAGEGGN